MGPVAPLTLRVGPSLIQWLCRWRRDPLRLSVTLSLTQTQIHTHTQLELKYRSLTPEVFLPSTDDASGLLLAGRHNS